MFSKIIVRFAIISFLFVGFLSAQEETPSPKEASPTVQQAQLSDDEIVALLKEKYQDTAMEGFVNSNPRLILLTVRVVRNEDIKKLWQETLKDKTRYYYFSAFFIFTIFISWWWKRRQIQTLAPIHHKIFTWLFRFSIINGSRLGAFVLLFQNEIAPVWELFKKTFGY